MTQSSLLVYVGDEKKMLPIGTEGPVFAEWPDTPERALLEWELVESRKESGQEPLTVEETLEALRSEGYYCRPADGSYGILNNRVLTRGFLPGVRTPLPERPGEPVRFPVGEEGVWLHCIRFRRRAPQPTIVLFHDRDEAAADWCERAKHFRHARLDLFIVEYRGYGSSEGTSDRLGDMLDDIPAIFEAVGIEAEQLIVYGRGVGAVFAMEFVDRFPNVRGLILESAVFDLKRNLLESVDLAEAGLTEEELDKALASALNQGAKLKRYTQPLLVIHSEVDERTPVADADAILAVAGSEEKVGVFVESGQSDSLFEEQAETLFTEIEEFAYERLRTERRARDEAID